MNHILWLKYPYCYKLFLIYYYDINNIMDNTNNTNNIMNLLINSELNSIDLTNIYIIKKYYNEMFEYVFDEMYEECNDGYIPYYEYMFYKYRNHIDFSNFIFGNKFIKSFKKTIKSFDEFIEYSGYDIRTLNDELLIDFLYDNFECLTNTMIIFAKNRIMLNDSNICIYKKINTIIYDIFNNDMIKNKLLTHDSIINYENNRITNSNILNFDYNYINILRKKYRNAFYMIESRYIDEDEYIDGDNILFESVKKISSLYDYSNFNKNLYIVKRFINITIPCKYKELHKNKYINIMNEILYYPNFGIEYFKCEKSFNKTI